MKTTLSIEESDRLIELGVDAKLASYHTIGVLLPTDEPHIYRQVGKNERAFTLTDILSILPKEIGNYELNISVTEEEYFVSYILWDSMDDCAYVRDVHSGDQFSAPELIDALYQLLIWAIENGYVKPDKQ